MGHIHPDDSMDHRDAFPVPGDLLSSDHDKVGRKVLSLLLEGQRVTLMDGAVLAFFGRGDAIVDGDEDFGTALETGVFQRAQILRRGEPAEDTWLRFNSLDMVYDRVIRACKEQPAKEVEAWYIGLTASNALRKINAQRPGAAGRGTNPGL
jgi:hypothetical protein